MIYWGRIFCFLHSLPRTLRKNLLLRPWGFFFCLLDLLGKNLLLPHRGYFGEESSASSQEIFLNMLGFLGEESSTSTVGMIFIREESFASLLEMMLDVF